MYFWIKTSRMYTFEVDKRAVEAKLQPNKEVIEMGAPSKAYKFSLMTCLPKPWRRQGVQLGQRLAASPKPISTFKEVTN